MAATAQRNGWFAGWKERWRTVWRNGFSCASCGRRPPCRGLSQCPYCGEEIAYPKGWRFARWCVWIIPVTTVAVALFSHAVPLQQIFAELSPFRAFALWGGLGVLALPPHEDHWIVSSSRELWWWRLTTLTMQLLSGVLFYLTISLLRQGGFAWRLGTLPALASLLTLPLFWRVSPVVCLLAFLLLALG